MTERACKPGSVSPWGDDGHLSGDAVTRGLVRPTRDSWRRGPRLVPYSALLRVGFTLPRMSPSGRWALTPPFHPYPVTGRYVFCCTFLNRR